MSAFVLKESAACGLSLLRMCRLLGLPRSSCYRNLKRAARQQREDLLREQIKRTALLWPSYGRPRITHELRRQGLVVNPKRIYRVMKEEGLVARKKKRFIRTTDSDHALEVYPNLAADLLVNGTNQLWVADLSYIRLKEEFVYLAVILDSFSRKAVGWALGRRLDASLPLQALEGALASRKHSSELVHHSDRGCQYASREYTGRLKERGIQISMSRKGNPYDNAFAESFFKTLKYEEVYLCEYRNLDHARTSIRCFIEEVYNQKRLHSAIGYMPPDEFEEITVSHSKPVNQP